MRTFTGTQRVLFSFLFFGVLLCQQSTLAILAIPIRSKKGMVVSAHPLASQVGVSMLAKGGNAVDAAVATTFALSVVEPFSAGIGGGGFLLMHSEKTGEIKALDFRERAPLKATKNMYLDSQGKVRPNASINGYLAVATPGTIAGMYEVQHRYGKLPWKEVIQPAIALAEKGYVISDYSVFPTIPAFSLRKQTILRNRAMKDIFFHDGDYYQPGERLIQHDLAETLKAIAVDPKSFYTGKIAHTIAADMVKNGGLITLADLKAYKPIWRTPVCGNFHAVKICSMPPPSSGGIILLEMLNIIGDWDQLAAWGWHNPNALHIMAEAMKIAYCDRAQYLGDPDFVKVPTQQLISPAYAKKRRQEINPDLAKPSTEVKPGLTTTPFQHESTETTHLNVVDAEHNAVSLTFTINLRFGAGVVTPGTGIILNNEMDDFAIASGVSNAFGLVGNSANAIAPGKTPLSSMTPTIITQNNHLQMTVGAPGGSTIITQVLQVILHVLVYKMDVGAAVSVPRIHHQWLPDELRVEKWGLDALTLVDLKRRGHKINQTEPWGNSNAIVVGEDGTLIGAADPRGEGVAVGNRE